MAEQFGELIPLEVDLSAAAVVPVQIMRPGTFTEMHGREVTITEGDMDDYVAAFESGKAGQELPIFRGHPPATDRASEPAGAWFKRLYIQVVDGIKTLWADIQLTDLGQQWLEGGLFKYLSPTVDLTNKVIRGGGFVNLPAIKGQPAIELSQFLREAAEEEPMTFAQRVIAVVRQAFGLTEHTEDGAGDPLDIPLPDFSEDGGDDMEEAQLREEIRAEVEAEFAQRKQEIANLAEKIRKETREQVLAEMAERQKLEGEVAEFAARVCGGEVGLSSPKDAVVAFLLGLTPEQREQAKKLLSQKVADFSEIGHTGSSKVKALPAEMASALRQFVRGRKDVADAVATFCEANGIEASDYDMSEFVPAQG